MSATWKASVEAGKKRGLTKQAPVWHYTKCRDLNSRLFTLAQTAWPQTGTCLLSRRLRSLKQAPVWHYTKCRDPNRRLFSFAQTGVTQTGACLLSRRLRGPKQAPVYPCAGLCRGRKVYSGTRPNFPSPAGARLPLRMALWWCKRHFRGSREGLLRGRGPIKISAGCLLLRPTKVF